VAVVPGYKIAELLTKIGNKISSSQIQPAGLDLTLSAVFTFEGEGAIGLEEVTLPSYQELEPSEDGFYRLSEGAYKIRFNEIVEVPNDCIGIAFPRSSLLRMGATINLAVWDPGYKGRGEALLLVFNEKSIQLRKGARVAQIVFIKLLEKPSQAYRGRYQYENI